MGQIVSTKMILVLCQRKSGPSGIGFHKNVKKTVVPLIESLVTEMMSSKSHVTHYLSDMRSVSYLQTEHLINEVDFDLKLDHEINNEKSKKFIESHQQYYDLLVLNTCPFRYILYDILFGLLKEKGLMVFSAIKDSVLKDIAEDKLSLSPEFHRYFLKQQHPKYLVFRRRSPQELHPSGKRKPNFHDDGDDTSKKIKYAQVNSVENET